MQKQMTFPHVCMAVLVAFVWGLTFVATKIGLKTYPPLLFAALRFALASVPLIPFIGRPDISAKWILGIGLTLGTCQFAFLFFGIEAGLPAGLASLVLQSQVPFTTILAVIVLRETIRPQGLVGLCLCFIGLAAVASQYAGDHATFAGFLAVLAAGSGWAMGNILVKKSRTAKPVNTIVWMSLVPPLPLLILSAVFEGRSSIQHALTDVHPSALLALCYLSGSTIVGFGLWARLVATYGPSTVAPFSLLVPFFGLCATAYYLHETLSLLTVGAAGVVICGLYLILGSPVTRIVSAFRQAVPVKSTGQTIPASELPPLINH